MFHSILTSQLFSPSVSDLSLFCFCSCLCQSSCSLHVSAGAGSSPVNAALLTMFHCSSVSVTGHVESELPHKECLKHKGQTHFASSDSEVEIVGVQEKPR